MPPRMTFFSSEVGKHRQAIEPIAEAADDRGFTVEFSPNKFKKTDIGVFSSKLSLNNPQAYTDLSVILFHGIDSAYSAGANRWNWSRFDIGLLPGPATSLRWQEDSIHPAARPKIGVFEVGWPKSDCLFDQKFENEVSSYRGMLELAHDLSVLYAPSFESDGNLRKFVNSLEDTNCNLLIKHGSYDDGSYSDTPIDTLYEEIQDMEDVHILDSQDNIFYPLAISEVLISESLSVSLEGLLTNTLPVAVTDWRSRSGKSLDSGMPEFVVGVRHDELADFVSNQKELYDRRNELDLYRDRHFTNLGNSAEVTIDLIESAFKGDQLPASQVNPKRLNRGKYAYSNLLNSVRNAYLYSIGYFRARTSDRQRKILKKIRIYRLLRSITA